MLVYKHLVCDIFRELSMVSVGLASSLVFSTLSLALRLLVSASPTWLLFPSLFSLFVVAVFSRYSSVFSVSSFHLAQACAR